jgi:N-acyl-D-aspartate/D-glutamate deacylase
MNPQKLIAPSLLAASIGCRAATPAASPESRPFDLVVRGGTILDGTGRAGYRADIGIRGAYIVAIGDLSRDSAATVVDARGLHVASGFINIHSHATPAGLTSSPNMLRQGVTTEITNADGMSPTGVAERLASIDSLHMLTNAGAYAPFNATWQRVVGNENRRPTREQIAAMTRLLDADLDAGAWGVSAGLDYKPAYFATTGEVVDVLAPLKKWRTNFPNHDRVTPESGYSSIAGMRETIVIGERAGLVPVITHMKLQGNEQGRASEALAMIDSATRRGTYTAIDVYPYLTGATGLGGLFVPAWALEGGRTALLARLKDSAQRARIVRETDEAITARVKSPANITIPGPAGGGKTIAQLMPALGATSGGDAVLRVLERAEAGMIFTFGIESDLVRILQHPDAASACDCGAQPNNPHPRHRGSFPRVIARYSREMPAITLADAVRKMSGLPATIIGLVDRGFIGVGMYADLTVFDSATVIDRSTFEKPTENPSGIRAVIVNGRVALRDDTPADTKHGRIIRRSGNMPSRPMSTSSQRQIRVSEARILIDVSQRLDDRSARGRVQIGDFSATRLGVLQTARGWAAITGVGRSGGGEERAFVAIVEDSDPFADGRRTVRLRIDGEMERLIPRITERR